MQAVDFPVEAIRAQISEGIDIMIHMSRMRDGSRRVVEISELDEVLDGQIRTNCLYRADCGMTGNRLIHREKLEIGDIDDKDAFAASESTFPIYFLDLSFLS